MSEDGYPGAQISTFVAGDGQIVARSTDPDQAIDLFKKMTHRVEEIMDAMVAIDTMASMKGLGRGNKTGANKPSYSGNTGNSKPAGKKSGSNDPNECEHGLPWKDMDGAQTKDGSPYKARFYCAFETKNWKERCKPWGQPS